SLNPVEGISTSDLNVQPSRAESAKATTDRTDAQTQKEQVRFMKITQNEVTVVADSREPGRSSRWRGRHRQHVRLGESVLWRTRARALPSIVAALFALLSATAFAQNADNIAEREVQRRQSGIPAGEAALARGKSAMHSKNYTVAYQEFKTAIAYLPDAVVSGRAHDEAAEGVCKSGTVLAEARIAEGDYAGAEAILS